MSRLSRLINAYPFTVILSAEQAHLPSDINDRHTLELVTRLIGRGHIAAEGVYNGVSEQSFIVGCNDFFDVSTLITLGLHDFEQDSVLVLDKRSDTATLVHRDKTVMIGSHLEAVAVRPNIDASTLVDSIHYVIV